MRVIDTRTGADLAVGTPVAHGDGESVTLLVVEPGILSARALVRSVYRDMSRIDTDMVDPMTGAIDTAQLPLVTSESWVDLTVRWTHPAFFLQHVAFLPS